MFPNKYEVAVKEYLYKFIGPERFERDKDVIERLGRTLITDNDFKAFMALAVDIYESAYLQAVEDYRKRFEELGFKIEIGSEVR